jgi:uncharacterized membrane protein YbhN (UPF0104 family)
MCEYPARAMSPRLFAALKLVVAAAIVGFLIATDRLDLAPLWAMAARPWAWLALLVAQLLILQLGILRWWVLLRAIQGHATPFRRLLVVSWIGFFFGLVAPSVIATDVTRYGYLQKEGVARADLVASLLLDRLCGLAGIVLLAGVCSHGAVAVLFGARAAWILGAIAAAAVILWIALVALRHRLALAGPIDRLRLALRAAAAARGSTACALLLSIVAHALKALSFYFLLRALDVPLSFAAFVSFAPAGLLVEALPLTPNGLGTAHLAFERFFAAHGITAGASLFNVYFLTRVLIGLFGGVLWLAQRERRTP